ncbi:biotin--[acetyl-CoA-carboxylase] ligase [Nocardiopsis sp. RSe5-2]|uniref:biotin--[biotin carboxyl-carrier protein] ligase n=1 Tax=Nocardiopsis endophytica TaxID=3018445 RepID=A0ABT4UA32_9ACTN|nr:biotin--[acetyl-CoA-carboxylase] ligase [Nocardiopsis endophytica]MDA2813808.1 biotin--[acetyl-CoA-carboxylase] ligase [Nocardiopsis endophytica]
MSATSSPYSDPDRPPLSERALNRALVRPETMWTGLEVVPALGSTNTELLARAREGAEAGRVLVTEHQTAGRGRLGRVFTTPDRAALTFSVLVRPRVGADALGWLPLAMGVAAVRACGYVAQVFPDLKWPNDVLGPSGGKLAGILAEADFSGGDPAVVVGMGLNVTQGRGELPVDTATSLVLEGDPHGDRDPLLRAVLRAFADVYRAWEAAGGDAEESGLAREYREHCATLGRRVRVHLPDGRVLEGEAGDVDAAGRLVVRPDAGAAEAVSAGDVVHVR